MVVRSTVSMRVPMAWNVAHGEIRRQVMRRPRETTFLSRIHHRPGETTPDASQTADIYEGISHTRNASPVIRPFSDYSNMYIETALFAATWLPQRVSVYTHTRTHVRTHARTLIHPRSHAFTRIYNSHLFALIWYKPRSLSSAPSRRHVFAYKGVHVCDTHGRARCVCTLVPYDRSRIPKEPRSKVKLKLRGCPKIPEIRLELLWW